MDLGLPPDVSTHGFAIDKLIWDVHLLMLVLGVGWILFFIFLLFRFRAGKNPKANYHGTKSKISKYVEVVVAIVEVVLLVGFSIPLYSARVSGFPEPPEAVEIRVVAQQFAWNFHYPGADGVFGKTDIYLIDDETNPLGLDRESEGGADDIYSVVLHVPVDSPVLAHLTSKDVIHCFSLPNLRIKQDIIPGMSIPVWFEAKETINAEIVCNQLCGLGHYRMRGVLIVETREAYDAWLAEEAVLLSEEEDAW